MGTPALCHLMTSCLYECHMTHRRRSPREHHFAYRIFLFAVDLDELDNLHRRLPFFSVDRRNIYSFGEGDYLPTDEPVHNASARPQSDLPTATVRVFNQPAPPTESSPPAHGSRLKLRVMAFAADHGVDLTHGRVVLVTLPRVFGTLFNPVSFYFCYDRSGVPVAAIAEVTNTFREMKPFFLGPATRSAIPQASESAVPSGSHKTPATAATFRLRVPKDFYVSPFSDVDVEFDFRLTAPGDHLAVQINDYSGGSRTFESTLTGRRQELTSARLGWYTIKYPLITLRIITLIHWHALLLWWKKIPWFPKAARSSRQRDLYRAHVSLRPTPVQLSTLVPATASASKSSTTLHAQKPV